jgi:hypothetical protein
VWDEGADILETMRQAEGNETQGALVLGTEIGVEGGHGLYTLASVRNKDPEFATFRALQDSTKAAQFAQVLTFGQYCLKLKNGDLLAAKVGTEYAAEQYDGGTDATRSFCSAFYEYASTIGGLEESKCATADMATLVNEGQTILNDNVELSEDGASLKKSSDEANLVATAAIKDATPIPTTTFDPLELCARIIVTRADLFRILPDLAADLELYSQFARNDPLYPGFFLPVKDDENLPAAALHVPGCMLERENIARGENQTANGVPWEHYHIDLHERDGLRLKPVEVGSLMHQVFDASARQADPTDPNIQPKFRPVLMKWHRPNAVFDRHRHFISSIIPGEYDKNQITQLGGDTYRLSRVELAPWTATCEAWRKAHYQGLCPASTPITTDGMSSTLPSFNPLNDGKNPTTPWKTVCYGESTKEAATCGLEFNEATHCDYKKERPRRLLMPRLEEYSPEVAHFLKAFEITTEDIEEMMGNWAYNDKYTTLMDKFKRRRHSVCDWVKNNRHKWDHFTYTGANGTRCLNETNYRIDGNGRYSPGIPCSGHGTCYEDKTRDFTRTPYADPTKQGGSNVAGEAGEEEEADPKLIAAHEAALDSVRGPFYAGVCKCDRGYIGDNCLELGEPEMGDVGFTDNLGFLMLAVTGGCGLFVVFLLVFIIGTRNEPVMAYCSTRYCLLIDISAGLALGSFVFWIGTPNFVSCVMRPVSSLVSLNLFTGTIFARVYRTTFILWGKSPPNVVITDPTYMMSILKKQAVPLLVLLGLFVVVCIFGNVAKSARIPQKDYMGYVWCDYGPTGTSVLAAATFYVAMIASWALADLYYLKKRVEYTGTEPFYHNERLDMTKAMVWVMSVCSGGFFFGLVFNLPSEMIHDALHLKFLFVTAASSAAALGGLVLVIWPKYRTIYVHPSKNIIFQGERFSVPVKEGGGEHQVEPSIDVNDMDPRLLRKNVALLRENLVYADKLGETKEELGRMHKLLLAYERSARVQTPATRPLTTENVSSAYIGSGGMETEATGNNQLDDGIGVGQWSELGSVSNPSLPAYDDEWDEEGSWHESWGEQENGGEGMDAILEGEEKEGEEEGNGAGKENAENAEETEKMEGDEEQGSAVDGQTESIAENNDELSENLEPSAPFDDEETSQMSMGSKGTQATQESKGSKGSKGSNGSNGSNGSKSPDGSQGTKSPRSEHPEADDNEITSQDDHREEHEMIEFEEREEGRMNAGQGDAPHDTVSEHSGLESQRSQSSGKNQKAPSVASAPSYHTPPFTPDNRGPQSSLDELALSNRLENLLYSTESQAGALLREMDAIRMEREMDRERMRNKTVRLNKMIQKYNAMSKKNKKLVRTLHNRSAPLPSVSQILMSQRLTQYERLFAKKKINSAMLLSMNDNDLWQTVSMKRGHRRKLIKALKKYLVGPKMPTLPTPAPTPIPSEPSTVRVLDEDEGLALESQQGSDHSSNESGSDSNDGSDSEGPSDVDDLGSESETEEHVVDMEGT